MREVGQQRCLRIFRCKFIGIMVRFVVEGFEVVAEIVEEVGVVFDCV
jgi:hypothetical protein